jgi:hypothetical protein
MEAKTKESNTTKIEIIEFKKGRYKFRIDSRNAEVGKRKDKWKKQKEDGKQILIYSKI